VTGLLSKPSLRSSAAKWTNGMRCLQLQSKNKIFVSGLPDKTIDFLNEYFLIPACDVAVTTLADGENRPEKQDQVQLPAI
jgi:hypothetical protein